MSSNARLFELYLKTDHWQQLVTRFLKGGKRICCKCGHSENLTARHCSFESLGCESVHDLEAICELCAEHARLSVPDIKECDPEGWVAYAVITSRSWNGHDSQVFEAWEKERTYSAALRAYSNAKSKHSRRKYADPERPAQGVDEHF